jgi:polyisoprenoid-binding protein YceI
MRIGLIALAGLWLASIPAAAQTFTFDKQHTEVRFSWDHLGLSRQSGKISDVVGSVVFDPASPETARVSVDLRVAALMTGVPALDSVLTKTKDYFDVGSHPTIAFQSTSVRMTGEKSAEVSGDLTINGITKPAVLAVVLNLLGAHPLGSVNPTYQDVVVAGFSARTQILRSDWGILRTIPLVSDEIRIAIEAEVTKAAP